MIKVLIEVDAAGFRVAVVAESIRQALKIVQGRYRGSDARVVFPLDSETFFVPDLAAMSAGIELEMPENVAG